MGSVGRLPGVTSYVNVYLSVEFHRYVGKVDFADQMLHDRAVFADAAAIEFSLNRIGRIFDCVRSACLQTAPCTHAVWAGGCPRASDGKDPPLYHSTYVIATRAIGRNHVSVAIRARTATLGRQPRINHRSFRAVTDIEVTIV